MKISIGLLRLSLVAAGIVALALAFAPQTAYADACVSTQSGDWQASSTWTSCGSSTPGDDDSATVSDGHTVTMSNSGGWNAANVTVASGGVLQLSNRFKVTSGSFDVNGTLIILGGGYVDNEGVAPTYGSSSLLQYDTNGSFGVSHEWGSTTPQNVEVVSGTTIDMPNVGRTVNGTLTIGGTMNLSSASGNDLVVKGNFLNNGTFNANGRLVTFNGSSEQQIGGANATTFQHLTINNGSWVRLYANQTVNGTLALTSGRLNVGDYILTIGSSGSISGGNVDNMVVTDYQVERTSVASTPPWDVTASMAAPRKGEAQVGKLCKVWGISAFTYPIGTFVGSAVYSPVTAVTVSGSPSGSPSVCFRVTDAASPNLPNNLATYITRYWTSTMSGGSISGLSYGATFNFVTDDKVGTQDMHGKKWNGSFPWVELDAVSGTSFSGSGLDSFSDFTAFRSGVLAVTLAEFYAQQVSDHVLVTWETASELGNMGFNLYRGTSPAGPDRRLNDLLIPSQSLGNPGGFVYTWEDYADLVSGTTYYYWLEDVDVNGAATRHGPVSVDFVAPTAVTLGGVAASPAAGAGALPWLLVVAAAGAALGVSRMRRENRG